MSTCSGTWREGRDHRLCCHRRAGGRVPPIADVTSEDWRRGRLAYALAACKGSSSKTSASVPRVSSPTEHDARVVVVGAGLAGTTAAYRLAQQGISVQLFEARDRVGGRCWTARSFADGQMAEHGGEFIDTRHVHLRGLAKELGLPLDDLWEGWMQGSIWPIGSAADHGSRRGPDSLDRISKAVTKRPPNRHLRFREATSYAYSYARPRPRRSRWSTMNIGSISMSRHPLRLRWVPE